MTNPKLLRRCPTSHLEGKYICLKESRASMKMIGEKLDTDWNKSMEVVGHMVVFCLERLPTSLLLNIQKGPAFSNESPGTIRTKQT